MAGYICDNCEGYFDSNEYICTPKPTEFYALLCPRCAEKEGLEIGTGEQLED